MKTSTVYAVVSGNYSDYQIHVLFPTEQAAQAHAKRRNQVERTHRYGKHEVEPFLLVEQGEPEPRIYWHANWYGKEIKVHNNIVWDADQYDEDHEYSKPVPTRPELQINTQNGQITWIGATGPDKRSVTKAVKDRLAQLKAEQAGIA